MEVTRHTFRLLSRLGGAVAAAAALAACGNGSPSSPPPPATVDTFTTSTYQQGTRLYLQNVTDHDTARIAVETAWGGAIVEISLDGANYVNAHDTGREVQVGLYDGDARYCCGLMGWDPVLGGDEHDQGSPTQIVTRGAASLYTSTQALEWHPDDKGGGPGHPVLSDVVIEQTILPVPGHARAFKVHYKITHLGVDQHTNAKQEIPAVYAIASDDRFVWYAGAAPWTNDALSTTQWPALDSSAHGGPPLRYASERWAAHVNAQNEGLAVYMPGQYPWVIGFTHAGPDGPTGDGTNYFSAFNPLTIGPGLVWEADVYVIAGDLTASRRVVYELHATLPATDVFPPIGAVNLPAEGATLSGIATVYGWALDDTQVVKVEVMIDGVVDGTATYGLARADVGTEFPNAPADVGFTYSLNSAKFANGPHLISARATDGSGNVAILPTVHVTVAN